MTLSLSQIKSEHIGGVARRELGDKECFRPVRRRAKPARPSPRIDACVPHYNISGKTAVRDGGAALRTQQRGQGIPVGSNRSAVRRIHFATGSVAPLVGREGPSIEVVGCFPIEPGLCVSFLEFGNMAGARCSITLVW